MNSEKTHGKLQSKSMVKFVPLNAETNLACTNEYGKSK